jgi:TonB-linked SusC/RagA family outer membrane protein
MFYKNIDLVQNSYAERGTDDYVRHESSKSRRWTWTNTAEYRTNIGLNSITLLAGSEAIDDTYYDNSASRYHYLSFNPDYMDLSSGVEGQTNGSNRRSWSVFSLFGRLNYVFDNKYMFEGVIRRDGSSRFAAGNRYGVFPAFSAGWVVSRENFMASTRSWLDNLKLRVGYGITGNDQMDSNYNSYSQYGFVQHDEHGSFYPLNGANSGQGTLGYRQNTLGNPNVKWESTKTFSIGIDAAFLGGFTLTADYYQRRTTDMLYPKAVPAVAGRATAPSVNVGEMFNRGFDIDLGYRGTALNRDLRYQVSLNFSTYKNELVNLTGNKDEFLDGSGFREQIYTRSMSGHAYPEFYGYIVDGIFQTKEEAAAWPVAFDQAYNEPGHYKFRDISGPDGVPDGKITTLDRTFIGSPHPDFYGGVNFNIEYKGFDLNGQFYGTYGNKMVNYSMRFINYYQFDGGRGYDYLYNSWGSPYLKDNAKAKLPKSDRSTVSQYPSTAFIEDASYLRLRNLQLGYNLSKLVNIPSVNSLRLYVQVTNLFTLTKYSGLDPDASRGESRDSARNFGVDSGAWPTPREIMFGLSIGL